MADVNRASRALRTSGRLPGKGKGKAGQVASKRKAIEQEWLREQPGSIPAAELEDRRAQLTKKAKLYRTLKKGKKAGLTGQQLDNILFDVSPSLPLFSISNSSFLILAFDSSNVRRLSRRDPMQDRNQVPMEGQMAPTQARIRTPNRSWRRVCPRK